MEGTRERVTRALGVTPYPRAITSNITIVTPPTMGLFLDTLALKTDKNEYFRKTFGRSRSLLCKCFESRGGYNNVKSSAFRSRSLSVIRTRSNREQKEEATAEVPHHFFYRRIYSWLPQRDLPVLSARARL